MSNYCAIKFDPQVLAALKAELGDGWRRKMRNHLYAFERVRDTEGRGWHIEALVTRKQYQWWKRRIATIYDHSDAPTKYTRLRGGKRRPTHSWGAGGDSRREHLPWNKRPVEGEQ
jgi:hypothetical protein|tara:strand:- start:257 stop:601 length:345 start_codon:yes stop_codon:yes gene_type:complete